jgi:hypothetical protein
MEWTEASVVLTRMAQFDTSLGYEVYNINAGFDLIDGRHRVVEL